MQPDLSTDALRSVIVAQFPDLAGSAFTLQTAGWACAAIDVDDRLIFKFPRNTEAEASLIREARLLAALRPVVTLPVPDLVMHRGPPLFSRHTKLKGEHLLTAHYERIPNAARDALAGGLAHFYAELHSIGSTTMTAAGAVPIKPWLSADDILACATPVLPPDLRRYAEHTILAWRDLPPDPHGTTYGFFDGHGWNMAFDHVHNRLNGMYDFGDSGFGLLHQEFIYSNFISPDLTRRIIASYETMTGRTIDRRRVDILTGVHRLSELAEYASDAQHAPAMIQNVADWAAREPEQLGP
jgi:aminoglycoside phosphotransferase (APT) family kinase protein